MPRDTAPRPLSHRADSILAPPRALKHRPGATTEVRLNIRPPRNISFLLVILERPLLLCCIDLSKIIGTHFSAPSPFPWQKREAPQPPILPVPQPKPPAFGGRSGCRC